MTYRRMALFVSCGCIGFDTVLFCAEQVSKCKRRKLRRQRIYPLIRTTSPAFGRTREDSIPSLGNESSSHDGLGKGEVE